MTADPYLILPAEPLPDEPRLVPQLVLAGGVAALLVRRGAMAENAYKARVKALVRPVQAADCAILIEGEPGWVRLLGADGLHVEGPVSAIRDAIGALKPEMIVGTGPVSTRHEAMERGELGVDYILFGPLSGATSPDQRDLARWWVETMQIPSVLSDPQATSATSAEGCEFIGLSASILDAADPLAAIAGFAAGADAEA